MTAVHMMEAMRARHSVRGGRAGDKPMIGRCIAFDVETPNYANNRMSAIGGSVVEDGATVDEFYSLVNPETRFDRFNGSLLTLRRIKRCK